MTTEYIPNEVKTVVLTGNGYLFMTSPYDVPETLKELRHQALKNYRHPESFRDLSLAKRVLDALHNEAYAITEDDTCIEFAEDFYC